MSQVIMMILLLIVIAHCLGERLLLICNKYLAYATSQKGLHYPRAKFPHPILYWVCVASLSSCTTTNRAVVHWPSPLQWNLIAVRIVSCRMGQVFFFSLFLSIHCSFFPWIIWWHLSLGTSPHVNSSNCNNGIEDRRHFLAILSVVAYYLCQCVWTRIWNSSN